MQLFESFLEYICTLQYIMTIFFSTNIFLNHLILIKKCSFLWQLHYLALFEYNLWNPLLILAWWKLKVAQFWKIVLAQQHFLAIIVCFHPKPILSSLNFGMVVPNIVASSLNVIVNSMHHVEYYFTTWCSICIIICSIQLS